MAREQLRDLRNINESTHAKLLDHNQRAGSFLILAESVTKLKPLQYRSRYGSKTSRDRLVVG